MRILIAVARDWGSIDGSNALSYVLVGGLAGLLAGLLALDVHMRRRIAGWTQEISIKSG